MHTVHPRAGTVSIFQASSAWKSLTLLSLVLSRAYPMFWLIFFLAGCFGSNPCFKKGLQAITWPGFLLSCNSARNWQVHGLGLAIPGGFDTSGGGVLVLLLFSSTLKWLLNLLEI